MSHHAGLVVLVSNNVPGVADVAYAGNTLLDLLIYGMLVWISQIACN
jgi:hypothetical protein